MRNEKEKSADTFTLNHRSVKSSLVKLSVNERFTVFLAFHQTNLITMDLAS